MAKRGEKEKKRISLLYFVLALALLSIIQPILIMLGLLPPVADYFSFGNLLFNLLKLAILIYCGIYFFKDGLKKSAFNGALMGFVSSVIIVIFAYISKQCCNIPILGIQVNQASYWLVMLFIVLENTVLWGIIAFISSWITSKFNKKN